MKKILFLIFIHTSFVGYAQQVVKVAINQQGIENCLNSTGIINPVQENYLKIFPNPTENVININIKQSADNKEFNVSLLNVLGQTVFQNSESSTSGSLITRIKVEDFPKGLYFLQITGNSYKTSQKVILINKK